MTLVTPIPEEIKQPLDDVKALLKQVPNGFERRGKYLTRKSLQLLKLLWENGNRKTVYTVLVRQSDLARKLDITRQALSIHFKRLRDFGYVQVGRGFVNVTEDGLKAVGYNSNPVVVTVRVAPQKRSEAFAKIRELAAIQMFRVTGDVDVVLIVEQEQLDLTLRTLTDIDGVLETRSLVSIEAVK